MAFTLDEVLDCPAPEGARRVGLELLDQTAVGHQRLQAASTDADALHDFRVALRRLRSWLRSFRTNLDDAVSAKVTRRLRALQDATGASRDADVQRAWLASQSAQLTTEVKQAADWLAGQLPAAGELDLDWLAKRFSRCEGVLHATFSSYTLKLPVGAPPTVSPFSWQWATVLRELLADVFEEASTAQGVEQAAALHRVRIRAKRLRYVLAPLKSLPEAAQALELLKARQDVLGSLNDLHQLLEQLSLAQANPGAAAVLGGIAALHGLARGQQAGAFEQYLAQKEDDLQLAQLVETVCSRLSRRRGLVVEVMPAP